MSKSSSRFHTVVEDGKLIFIKEIRWNFDGELIRWYNKGNRGNRIWCNFDRSIRVFIVNGEDQEAMVLRVTITKLGSRINVRNDERTWIYNARSQAEIETFDTRGGTIKR